MKTECIGIKNEKINNKGVIINMEKYNNAIFDKNTINHLIKSEADITNGRTRNAKEVINEFKEKYGF